MNHALRCVSRDGTVSTLCGNGEEGFVDGEAPDARFYCPHSVVQAASGELVVADCYNNAIRVVTPTGTVRTLCGNGQAGFSDGTGTDARFNRPTGLAWDSDGTLLVLLLSIYPSIHLSIYTHTYAYIHICRPATLHSWTSSLSRRGVAAVGDVHQRRQTGATGRCCGRGTRC